MPNTKLRPLDLPASALLLGLFLIMLVSSFIGQAGMFALADWAGFDLHALLEGQIADLPFGKRNLLRFLVLVNHLFTFFIPALLVGWLWMKKDCWRFLCLNRLPPFTAMGWAMVWMVLAFPLVQYIYWLNRQLPLPEWAVEMEKSTDKLVQMLLVMDHPVEMWFSLLVMAFIPAIGEELFFRGIIQQVSEHFFKKPVLAVWLTALIFSAFHFQFQGFIPRFFLGAMLGFLFYWSRNLWVPIAAHFFNNAIQVVGAYYWKEELFDQQAADQQNVSWWLATLSLCFVLGGGYQLRSYWRDEGDSNQKFTP